MADYINFEAEDDLKILKTLMKYQTYAKALKANLKLIILKILKQILKNLKKLYFQRLTLTIKKFTINFLAQYYMLCDSIKQDLKINVINKNLKKVLIKVLFKNLLTNLNLLSIYKNFITCVMKSIPSC